MLPGDLSGFNAPEEPVPELVTINPTMRVAITLLDGSVEPEFPIYLGNTAGDIVPEPDDGVVELWDGEVLVPAHTVMTTYMTEHPQAALSLRLA